MCLRAWPAVHPSRERLRQIHYGMHELTAAGIAFTPKLHYTAGGESVASANDRLWELTSWLPGQPDYHHRSSTIKLVNAARCLAHLHNVWFRRHRWDRSPTIDDRLANLLRWREILESGLSLDSWATATPMDVDTTQLARQTVEAYHSRRRRLQGRLQQLAGQTTIVHFVLRDIWSDHVLFVGDEVSGIIDFGAARIDDRRTDVVRLLSSLEPFDSSRWRVGFQAYQESLDDASQIELGELRIMDEAATLLSALQWMRWLCIEHRSFEQPRVELLDRWQTFLRRLESVYPIKPEIP